MEYFTGYDWDSHSETLHIVEGYKHNGYVEIISQFFVNTRDKIIQQKLIEMGWTPPKEADGISTQERKYP